MITTDKDKPFAKSLEGKELKMEMLCPNCSAVMTIRTNNTKKIIEATRKDTLKEVIKLIEEHINCDKYHEVETSFDSYYKVTCLHVIKEKLEKEVQKK
jgi:hypothetical protein